MTGHGPTLIPVDRRGCPSIPGVGYLDDRVKKYVKALAEKAGNRLTSTMYLPIALFFKEEQPEIYGNTHKIPPVLRLSRHLLTGEYTASASSPGIRPWDDEALRIGGLTAAKFPSVSFMGREIGRTTRRARERFGVPAGLPVYAVGVDFAAALVGAGRAREGQVLRTRGLFGRNQPLLGPFRRRQKAPELRALHRGVVERGGHHEHLGLAVDWAECALGIERTPSVRCGEVPKRVIFFPYLKGERTPLWDPYRRAGFYGLRLEHTKGDLDPRRLPRDHPRDPGLHPDHRRERLRLHGHRS